MARSSVEIVARGKDARLATETGCEHVQLSRRARRLQPFCTDCGSTDELQLDHMAHLGARRGREGGPAQGTPEAWSVVPVTAVVEPSVDARTTKGKGPRRATLRTAGQGAKAVTQGDLRLRGRQEVADELSATRPELGPRRCCRRGVPLSGEPAARLRRSGPRKGRRPSRSRGRPMRA